MISIFRGPKIYIGVWIDEWLSHGITLLTYTPLMISIHDLFQSGKTSKEFFKLLMVGAIVTVFSLIVFQLQNPNWFLLSFPLILTISIWMQETHTRLAGSLIITFLYLSILNGHGSTPTNDILSSMFIKLFVIAVAITTVSLSYIPKLKKKLLPITVLIISWSITTWMFQTTEQSEAEKDHQIFLHYVALYQQQGLALLYVNRL